MKITFQKHRGKNPTLHCQRNDETITYTNMMPFMVMHDLAHYAVEHTLNLTEGFYGMVSKGINIHDFELPKHLRPDLPIQAIQIEYIVNLLTTEMADSKLLTDFNATLQACFKENNCSPMRISIIELEQIRDLFQQLWKEWETLDEGDVLTLRFLQNGIS